MLDLSKDKPQKQNPGDTIGEDRSMPSKVNERWAGSQGGGERSWEIGFTRTLSLFPRLMAHSLLEIRAHLGFLRDNNMGKEPRAGHILDS